MAYGIGQISGCHINPAVSFGVLVASRIDGVIFSSSKVPGVTVGG
jgi:aquaporin Z